MKKLILMTLAAISLAGCSQDESEELNKDSMKINFGAGINVTTKVESGADGLPTSPITGIQILRGTDGANPEFNVVSAIATAGDLAINGTLTVATAQYFAINKVDANFMAFYPAGSFTTGKVAYTIDGSTDIIVSDMAKATKENATAQFAFKHKLARVKLIVKASDANAATIYGDLTVATINVPTALDLMINANGTSTIAANSTPIAADLSFGTATLTTEGGIATKELMILPTSPSEIKLQFANEANGPKSYTITGLSLVAGRVTTITATVNAKNVSFTSTIEQWVDGGNNGGTVVE